MLTLIVFLFRNYDLLRVIDAFEFIRPTQIQVDLFHFMNCLNEKKHFYGTSPPGSGKTTGVLLSMFKTLLKSNRGNVHGQFLIVCTTFDMAYATLRLANEIEAQLRNDRRQFRIGFVSKETDPEQPIADFDVIICTKSEIDAKPFARIDNQIKHVILDDADGYLLQQKVVTMIENLQNATFIVLSTIKVPQVAMLLPLGTAVCRHYDWRDERLYIRSIPSTYVSSMDFKLIAIKRIHDTLTAICPDGQMVVFCRVSHNYN